MRTWGFLVWTVAFILGCSHSSHLLQSRGLASEMSALASLQGVIKSHGGDSDIYYIDDEKLGRVYLEQASPEAYADIRAAVDSKATVNGTWDESQTSKLVFIVNDVESTMPKERPDFRY